VEVVEISNCTNTVQDYTIVVNRWDGVGTPRIDFFADGDMIALDHTTASSLTEPATSPEALTVGAFCAATGAVRSYSGRGPTIDGRAKPDLLAPDGVSTATYGPASGCSQGFLGTSAAAPHVAGAAAVLLAANPDLEPPQLEQALLDRALDKGQGGRDDVFGSGLLRLGALDGVPAPVPQPLTAITPQRWFDSRPGPLGTGEATFGSNGRTTPLAAGEDIAIPVAGVGNVPADATAVVLNVTAIGSAAGWLTVHPEASVPTSSNLNFTAGQVVAVHVTATVGHDGKVRFANPRGQTDLVIDLAGWYGPTGGGNARLTTLEHQVRAFDSRPSGSGYAEEAFGANGRTTPLGAGQTVDVQVAGLGGVTANATAVVMNLTATAPTAAGWLTAYPTGAVAPLASSLNFAPGQTVANLVVVPVGTDGKITIANARGSTDVVIDVVGSYAADGTGAGYVAMDPPTRILDTRTGNGDPHWPQGQPLGQYHEAQLPTNGHLLPRAAVATLTSVTSVGASQPGWFTLDPLARGDLSTSNLNFAAGQTVANAALTRALPVDPELAIPGALYIYNARGDAHAIVDLMGYFMPMPS
jgi:hypothetical protein